VWVELICAGGRRKEMWFGLQKVQNHVFFMANVKCPSMCEFAFDRVGDKRRVYKNKMCQNECTLDAAEGQHFGRKQFLARDSG
jgi:hypothetical protein